MRNLILLSLIVIVLLGSVTPAMTVDLEMTKPCLAKNDAEIFCIKQGGCPQTGYCYFPDGSYNLVWSLYDRICEDCDIWALSDQGTSIMEAYRFLGSADCYSNPSSLVNATTTNGSNINLHNNTICPSSV